MLAGRAWDSAEPGTELGLGLAADQDREQEAPALVASVRAVSVRASAVLSWRTAYPRRHP